MVFNGKKNTSKLNKQYNQFIKHYNQNSDKGYILEVDDENFKKLYNLYNDLPFLPERMKIKKCSKLLCNLYHKNNFVVDIRTSKQA